MPVPDAFPDPSDGDSGLPPSGDARRARLGPPEPAELGLLSEYRPPQTTERVGRHVALALATFASMVWAGGTISGLAGRFTLREWIVGPLDLTVFSLLVDDGFLSVGLAYAVPFFLFLTVHEFGHYLAARRHRVSVSLPYYIPIPLTGTLGTFGAVIRIREPIRRTRQLFDIGAAGPLAGVVVAILATAWAAWSLPPPAYLLDVPGHEDVMAALMQTGAFPPFEGVSAGAQALVFGDTPLFHLLGSLGPYRVPGHEIMHYPVLLAGWLGLFFTALNLLPVGQLDGGHVVYALFGPRVHSVVARVTTLLLLLSGAIGAAGDLVPWIGEATGVGEIAGWAVLAVVVAGATRRLFDDEWRIVLPAVAAVLGLVVWMVFGLPGLAAEVGYTGWLFWIGLILFVIRVDHPPVLVPDALSPRQRALGYLCLVLFVLCFSIQPIQVLG